MPTHPTDAMQNVDGAHREDPLGESAAGSSVGDRWVSVSRRWAPAAVVLVAATVSLIRNDVEWSEIAAYATYFAVGVVLPGVLCFRLLIGRRRYLVEEVALGAVTGLALQVVVWMVLRWLRLDVLIPWWWISVVAVFVLVPSLRRHWSSRFDDVVPSAWSWSMASISVFLVGFVDLRWFRVNPLPPSGGVAHVDTWWHLAIVREFLRTGSPQIPQVAGEPLSYHANAHAHVAISAVTSRVDADVVFLRLWMIPIVLVAVGVFAVVARDLSGRLWTGPLAVAMMCVLLAGGYLWVGLSPRTTPFIPLSPSQMMVLPFAFGAAWAMVRVVRGRIDPPGWAWLALLTFAGSGAKPTMIPIFIGGTLLTILFLFLSDRTALRGPLIALAGLVAVQLWTLSGGLGERGSRITLLGSLRSEQIYRSITRDDSVLGENSGLVLDSLSGGRALAAAGLTLGWFLLAQIFHFVGVAGVFDRRCRRDPATWWLIGTLGAGVAVYFALDHSALSQSYFLHLSLPFGILLTTMLISSVYSDIQRPRAYAVAAFGAALGAVVAMCARGLSRAGESVGGFGVLDRLFTPVLVVLSAIAVVWLVCRRWPQRTISSSREGAGLALAAIIGVTIPSSIDAVANQAVDWIQPPEQQFDVDAPGFLSADEQAAAVWLDENSDETDVVASNTQCFGLTTDVNRCNAVGFMVSGIAGRRVVLEGWGYTAPAHAAHMENGVHRNRTPPGWPERYERSIAAIEDPSAEVIDALADDYGTEWIFAARRAGPVSDRIADFATPVFDNGAVAIYRIPEPSGPTE